jgi:ribosome maturation factor RimP
LALLCGGLAIPLTSILVGNVTEPRVLEQSLGKVAEEGGYRLMKLRKTREGPVRLIDIELAGAGAPDMVLVAELKEIAESVTNRNVKLRVRTLLEVHSE